MNAAQPVKLVAIAGGSGAGTSWLAGRLHTLLGERATRLTLGDFYRDRSHLPPSRRATVNLYHPNAIEWPLFERVLQDCAAGRPVHVPRYDSRTHCRVPTNGELFRPRAVLLVDGMWLLLRPSLRRLFDLKIFIECAAQQRLRHRLARDAVERRHSVAEIRRHFRTTVEPMHRRHVAPQARRADLVLHQPFTDEQVRQLHERIWNLLKNSSLLPAWMRETFRAELNALLQTKESQS
jgi:uridine kinase